VHASRQVMFTPLFIFEYRFNNIEDVKNTVF